MNRQVNATVAILLGLLAGAAYQGRAADDVPTHKTLFFNTYYPKAGQSGMNVNPGDVRSAAGTLYEGWWREESYWRSNPTNGFGVHGFNMKTKVYGDKAMQWTHGIAADMNSPAGWTLLTPLKPRIKPDYSGEPNREDRAAPKNHPGQLHGGKGSLRDNVWTSGERFTDQMTVLTQFLNDPPNGEWDGVLLPEDYWNADNTTQLTITDLRRSLVTYPTAPKDWDYLRGEYYADYNNDTRVNNATTRVVNVGFQTNLLIWVADTRVGHGTNVPVRISEQMIEIPDLTSVPPSSFPYTVTNPPVVGYSNVWIDTSVTYPPNYVFTFTNSVPVFIPGLGWINQQIVSTTSFPFNIVVPSSNLVVTPYINAPVVDTYTNYLIVLNADTNGLFAHGDFNHTLVQGNLASGNVSESRNQLFDYDCDQNFNPIVYPAFQNGLTGVNETNRAYVVYQSYLWIAPAQRYLSGSAVPPDNYYQIANTSSGNPDANPGLPPSYQNDFGTTNVTADPYSAQIRLCKIYVPIYQAGELWGRFLATNGSTVVYWDDTRSFTNANTGQVTKYPQDNRWTPGRDHEPYEDFLSWWVPDAIAWVDGVVGVNTNGVIHEGPSPLSDHLIRNNAKYPITFQEYTNYIYNNYPGDCVSLVKRCGNGYYDGPDMWTSMGTADENKLQQLGYLTLVTPYPGTYGASGWDRDSHGNSVYGGTFEGWWQTHYAATSVGSPNWVFPIPSVITWPGIATDAYVSVVSTTMVQNASVLVYSSVTYPPIGSTWGYKSPREFDDLPSAVYHSAGDGRLGESTCPWDWSVFGSDKGLDNPAIRNMSGGDTLIPAAGPMAFDIHATEGLDAGNQLTIEWLTRRTDGQFLTGPKGGGVGSGPVGPPYTRDHRDVNLDGLIDQGETVPPRSANYSVDPNPVTPDGGRSTIYPYNWQRYFEDCVEAWDTTEDFNALLHNNSNGALTQEIRFQAPSTFTWPNGIGSTNSYLANVRYHLNPNPPHTGFNPAIDDMWLDSNGDTYYNSELVLNNASGTLSFGTLGTPFPLNRVKYIDIDNNTAFTPALEYAWYDANNNGSNDTDLVLSDAQYTTTNRLTNGAIGVRFNTRFDVGVSDSEKVYYQECDGIPGPTMGDNFWLENRYTNTTTVGVYDTDGIDTILYAGTTGDVLINGTPGTYLPGACYQALNRSGPGSDVGWLPGDNVWVDTMAGGSAGVFDCEDAVHAPYGICPLNYPFLYRARVIFLFTSGTSLKLNHVCYVNRPGGTVNYERKYDDVWIDSDGNNVYNQEYAICNNGGLVDGTPGVLMPNVAWLDMDNNGVYTPITDVTYGEASYTVGDVLWYDYNGNHAYDMGDSYTIPLYFMGWGNPQNTFNVGPHVAGFGYGVRTRDGVSLGGFGHVWPASVAGFAGPTHEQGHELVGWPDYYDYNISDPDVYHLPIGIYDLMAVGGLVHGIGSTKLSSGWVTPQYLNGIAIGGGASSSPAVLRGPNAGRQTVLMYPIERMPDQYFTFVNPALPTEGFNFWYASGQSVYSVFNTPGVVIEHFDGDPLQQRANDRYKSVIVQADGLYQMEDGINAGDTGDLWGPTKKVFNEYSVPPARWWSQAEAGVRILDIRLPANPLDPAEVDFEWVATTNQWFWVGPMGAGSAGSSATGSGGTNAAATNAASATPSVALPSVPGVGAGIGGGFFGVQAGGNRGDSDGDGLPDAWEIYWFGRYVNPLTYMNAATDYDRDGLPDYAEWLAHLNPMYPWSWINLPTNITDADADIDGDMIGNLDEYEMGLNMREPDSDDDGWSDSEELNPNILKADQTGPNGFRRITSPIYSRSPLIERSVHLTAADRLTIPSWEINDYTRFMVTNWTVEAWVKLDSSNETGTIVSRVTPQGATTFEIGIRTNRPYAAFSTEGLNVYRVEMASANAALVSNTWYHIAGVFDQASGALCLYLDGDLCLSMTALESPATGHPTLLHGLNETGTVRLGGGFNGFVDEVRIWGSPRTSDQIALEYNTIINSPWVPGFVVSGGALVPVALTNSIGNDGTLISNLRFDDGQNTTITNKLDGTVHSAGIEDWVHPLGPNEGVYWNRLPDNGISYGYCVRLPRPDMLTSNEEDVVYLKLSRLQPSPIDDLNEDGIPDWWQDLYWPTFDPTVSGPWDPAADPDNDGLTNADEYDLDTNPTKAYTSGGVITDGSSDADGDGLSNADEQHLFLTDPKNPDTDDDGIPDGEEIGVPSVLQTHKLAYGVQNVVSGPTDSLSPWIPRSLILGLADNPAGLLVPHSERFTFSTTVVGGPVVKITAPLNGASIGVRFTAVQGGVVSATPLNRVRLYNNNLYVADLTLDVSSNFNYTAIIRSGVNALTVVAVDTEGLVGTDTVTVTGTFAPADIRVTQTWDQPGDLDTWLIDPRGRHMGWSPGGPGLPADAGPGQRIPGAFLDIDDISGVGPENITVQRGSATTGVYNVWMDNYSNRNSPNSRVRVLVKEGQPGEKYVEFGPQAMTDSDGNGSNPQAWWHTTDITWPDGTMNPPGTPVSGNSDRTIDDEGIGFNAAKGWTIEGWIKTGNTNQTGAIARYRLDSGNDSFVVGLSSNRPYMMVRSSNGTRYELLANPLPANEWVHLAFVYGEGRKTIRIHENGVLVCARTMLETRNVLRGWMYVDAPLALTASTNRFTSAKLDELRFWKLARSGGLIAQNMHAFVDTAKSLIGGYHFDDGGLGIEDMKFTTNRKYDLGGFPLPDLLTDPKPGPDGIWGTGDDIPAGVGSDGQNDFVTATDWAPVYGIRDANNNGLPDWFEKLYGVTDPFADPDGDGLNNLYEYWCGTNPLEVDSNGNGVSDANEDFDHDGLSNLAEQTAGTDPRIADTDDDGLNDALEIRYVTDGVDSENPSRQRSLAVDGSASSYVRAAASTRFALGAFDISAWVYATNVNAGSEIVARQVEPGRFNYVLGIDPFRIPYIGFRSSDNTTNVTLLAPVFNGALPLNEWRYLRAIFDDKTGRLDLYIGSATERPTLVASLITEKRPKADGLGPVEVRVGKGFAGLIDDVLVKGAPDTVLDYRFDDGTAAGGTSGMRNHLGWQTGGQVQDFSVANGEWLNHWTDAGTLMGNATIYDNFGAEDPEPVLDLYLDSDGDGLPDWWELANGLNPYKADSFGDGIWDGDRDMDHDGLSNLYEYLGGTNPWNPETTPGIPDGSIDADGDGLNNLHEQFYHTDPLRADTDDDGIPDGVEASGTGDPAHPGWFTLPNASLSPAVSGALQITAPGQYLQLPAQSRLAIDGSWTVEAWVNISNAFTGTGTVIQRAIGTTVNYELGFTNGVPIARMVGTYRGTLYPFTASGTALARRNQWYHLAAVYDETAGELRLLVDGSIVGRATVTPKPATSSDGTGSLIARVGDRFNGLIDEVRIWNQALTSTNIALNAFQTFETVPGGLVLYYRFDDGPFNVGTTTNRFGLAINTVEDFASEPNDWLQNWRHAGVLKGGAVMVPAATPIPVTQFVDADSDGLPDFWEIAAFGSISTYSGKDDPDGDGLNNFYEYRAHLNPLAARTYVWFGDNTPDADRDSDNDGLINSVEQELGTLPDQVDTDDDGKWDGAEVTGVDLLGNHVGKSDPLNSLSPVLPKSLSLNGNSRVVVPAQARHAMADAWTIAAWVWPSNNASGIVVGRLLADNSANYELGVTNNGGILSPYARYSGKVGNGVQDIVVAVGQPNVTFYNATNRFMTIAPQSWTHLAASYQAASNRLSLFVDGELVAYRTDATLLPVTGAGPGLPLGGELAIGGGRKNILGNGVAGGFEGYIDDVRLAAKAYGAAEIRQMARGQLVAVGAHSTNTTASGTATQLAANSSALLSKPDELIVCLRPGVDKTAMSDALNVSGLQVLHKYTIIPGFHVKITDGSSVTDKIAALKQDKRIAYAEPNFTRHFVDTLPNDTRFAQQWALHNTVNTNADIKAPVAWDVSTGSRDIVVAVIDSGVDYNHEDLKDNMWRNPGEIPGNGIDDDGNGYIDDVYGYDFGDGDADPMDDVVGHGTHCAGIIGATGNNALGTCGVNWQVKLMACKIADAGGNLVSSAIIEALDYAWKMGARVSNNSYGGLGFSQAEYDAVKKAGDNNHLFIAAAGNNGTDNDSLPFYPASFDLDNVVAVAATDNADGLASFSCYGLQSVDLGAPGVNIMSTLPTNGSSMGKSYGNASGTSMACPHVAGAAALILSVDSGLSYSALRAAILNNVDPIPSLAGKTVTGGRLNIGNILPNMGGGGGGGSVIRNGLVGWFKFWDGGRTVQDFTRATDWIGDWRFAGVLDGAVVTNDSPDHVYLPTGDSDGDGLPDWWEEAMGLDPFDGTGDNGAEGDPDGDGLTNLYEYLAGTDPLQWDSAASGVSDYDKDSDHDGISNGNEQDVTFTDPGDANTDDDDVAGGVNGLTAHDGEELTAGMRPADSLSPFNLRALEFQGSLVPGENVVIVKDKIDGLFTSRHSMSEWTIQAYVNPYALTAGVYPLISRSTFAENRRNYELGIANGVPYIAFDSSVTGTNVVLSMPASQTLGLNEWVHLTGRFTKSENGLDNELALFVNGVKVAARHTGWMPAVGPGDVTFGSPGFRGMLNNIRLWKIPQADEMIAGTRNNTLLYGNADAMAGRLLVTGDQGHLKETATTLQPNGEYVDMLRQNWTLECWVKTRATGGRLILRRNQGARTDDDFNYYLGITPGGTLIGRFAMDYTYVIITPAGPALVYVRDYTLNNMTGEIPVNDGNWHHVAYVRSDSGCALYVDGMLDASQKRTVWPPAIPPGSYAVFPAVYAQPGPCIFGEDLAGEMDEIRIWNRALPTAELKNVAGRNLSGTERGLITYFNFDFQLGKTADERAVIRDPTVEYGIYIPNASNLQGGSSGGAPISYDPLLSVQRVALMGMFPCVDGGVTVEDFIYRMGNAPFNFGSYAGHRGATVIFRDLTAANYPFSADSDNDGLPDAWEVKYGLDPSDPSGINGPYGDPDGDGLDNAAEYLAGTDPRNANTPGSDGYEQGYSDFYHRANTNSLSYGELYTAMDSLPSLWKFNHGLDPNSYEAENDPDHDGWSNYAEYMAGTNPQDQTSVPRPSLNVKVWYAGTPPAADLKIESFTVASMDGVPDARFTYTLVATNSYPVSFNLTGTTNVTGWMREGTNWFFAYVDRNGNNQWDVGEPCGTAMYQPLNLTWGTLALDLNLSDKAPGFPRIQWALPAGVAQTRVQVDYAYMSGGYTNYTTVVDTTLQAPRSWLTEADVIRSGLPKGLGTPSQSSIWQPVYRWSAQFDPPGGSTTYVPSTPYVFFTQTWFSVVVNKPILVHPLNETVQTLPLTLEWKATDQTAAFLLEVRRNSTGGTVWFNTTVRPPSIAANAGLVSYVFQPQFEQTTFRAMPDGEYWWRVKTDNNPTLGSPVWSDWSRFVVDTAGAYLPTGTASSVTGPFSITGNLEYFGKVANHAEDQLIQTNWVSRTNLNITLPPGKAVTPGTLTLMLRQPGVFPDLVTFTDAGITTFTNANQTLRVDASRSQSAWTSSVCRVNYNTGVILSMIFPSVPTNAVLLGRYDYLGDYPFVIQAYRMLSLPGFSGHPVAQISVNKKGPFTITGLPSDNYVLLGFLDQFGTSRLQSPESWGFVRNLVPLSGPGYIEIHPLTVGPSISTNAGVRLTIRDRDTDNDKLPDAWELKQFGSISQYSGQDVVIAGDLNLWDKYARGALDDDPHATDSDYDGLADVLEKLFGTDSHNPSSLGNGVPDLVAYLNGDKSGSGVFTIGMAMNVHSVAGLSMATAAQAAAQTGGADAPVITWRSPAIASDGVGVQYIVERADTLANGGNWAPIPGGTVIAWPGEAAQTRVFVDTERKESGFYRVTRQLLGK